MGGKRRLYLLQGQAEKGVGPGSFAADLPGIEQLSAGVVDRALPGQPAIDECALRAADAQQRIVKLAMPMVDAPPELALIP